MTRSLPMDFPTLSLLKFVLCSIANKAGDSNKEDHGCEYETHEKQYEQHATGAHTAPTENDVSAGSELLEITFCIA